MTFGGLLLILWMSVVSSELTAMGFLEGLVWLVEVQVQEEK